MTHPVGAFFLVSVNGAAGFGIELGQVLAGSPSKYQHAGVVIDGDGTTVEAQPGGARLGKLSDYHDRTLLVCDGPVQMWLEHGSPHEVADPPLARWERELLDIRGTVAAEARKLLGTPYSALDYLALAALHLHLPSRWVRRRVETSGHLICSALVDRALSNAGVHLYSDGRLPGDVMPSDLDKWAQEHGPTIGGTS